MLIKLFFINFCLLNSFSLYYDERNNMNNNIIESLIKNKNDEKQDIFLKIPSKRKQKLKIIFYIILVLHFFNLIPIINGIIYGQCKIFTINQCVDLFNYIFNIIFSVIFFCIGIIFTIQHLIILKKMKISKKEIHSQLFLSFIVTGLLLFNIILFIIGCVEKTYPLQKILLDPSIPLSIGIEILGIFLVAKRIIEFFIHGILIFYLLKILKKF